MRTIQSRLWISWAAVSWLGAFSAAGAQSPLEQRIDRLEAEIARLKNQVMYQEPAEEVRRVAMYVCPTGHAYDHPGNDGHCPVDGEKLRKRTILRKFRYSRRESISDLIEGAIQSSKRLDMGMSATYSFQQILSGARPRSAFNGGSADLLLTGTPFYTGTFFTDLEVVGGRGPDQILQTIGGINDDLTGRGATNSRIVVREAWLEAAPFRQNLRIVLGKVDLTNYFEQNGFANDETSQFLASPFVNNPALEPPVNGPGLIAQWNSRRGFVLGGGVQSLLGTGDHRDDDVFGIAELAWTHTLLFRRNGTWRVWSRVQSTEGQPLAWGFSLDQRITPWWGIFGRFGKADLRTPTEIRRAWSAGFGFDNALLASVNDKAGVAFGGQENTDGSLERLGEVFYNFFLSDHFRLSLHGQLVFQSVALASEGNPDGRALRRAAVAGVRAQFEF